MLGRIGANVGRHARVGGVRCGKWGARDWRTGVEKRASLGLSKRELSGGGRRTADFLVVGGGIIGLNIARELALQHPGASIRLLEKEKRLGEHASGRNSGVLHAGFYYSADSLKAKLTRAGNLFLHDFCEKKGLRINKCGKLVVAQNEGELEGLDELYRRGVANGVPVEMISAEDASKIEPLVKTHDRALWSPSTAAADPLEVTLAIGEEAKAMGVEVELESGFKQVHGVGGNGPVTVQTLQGDFIEANHVVNCAGLYADRVAQQFGFGKHLRMLPFKGLYLYCDVPLKTLIYPVPDISMPFLGVHFTVTVDGKVKIGPTAIPSLWREQYGFTNPNLEELVETLSTEANLFLFGANFPFRELAWKEARKYSKSFMAQGASELAHGVDLSKFTTYGKPGIRAQLLDLKKRALVMDFLVEGDQGSTHVLNAVSPAWTCSQPFAEHVVKNIKV